MAHTIPGALDSLRLSIQEGPYHYPKKAHTKLFVSPGFQKKYRARLRRENSPLVWPDQSNCQVFLKKKKSGGNSKSLAVFENATTFDTTSNYDPLQTAACAN